MKRLVLGLGVAAICTMPLYVVAQSLTLSDTVEHVYGSYDQFELVSEVEVFNVSSGDLDVKVKRIENILVSGMENAICWEQCYIPTVSVSPTSMTIVSGGSISVFSGHLYPNQMGGSSDIFYVFYDENNINDSVVLHVYYQVYGLSISEEEGAFSLYPNPTNGILNVELNTSSDILPIVFSALGQQLSVNWNRISSEKIQADLRSLPKGMYFVKFNGRTQRVVLN